jgi:4-amino-4-deoxy-L-arabinose transferase-like glycosyltransferase
MAVRRHDTDSTFPWIRVVLAVAVLARVAYLFTYSHLPEWTLLTVDNYYHHHWAQTVADGDLIGGTTYFRGPLYVWCLGLLYAVLGDSLWVGRVFGAVIGLLSVYMTWHLGRRVFGATAGIVAASLQAVFPIVIYFEAELLVDPLFMLLLQIAVFRMLIWWDSPLPRNLALAGLMLGLACITRPTGLILIPLLAALPLIRDGVQKRLMMSSVGIAACLLVILPITVRNTLVADDPTLIASQGGINFYLGNNPQADGLSAIMPEPLGYNWRIADVVHEASQAEGRELSPGEVSRFWYGRAFDWIREHPLDCARLYLKKLYFQISSQEISNNRDLSVYFGRLLYFRLFPIPIGVVLSLATLAVVLLWNRNKQLRLLVLIILLYAAVSSAFFYTSRFRLPLLPLYFVLAGAGVTAVSFFIRERGLRRIVALVAAFGIGVISIVPMYRLPEANHAQALTSFGRHYYRLGQLQIAESYFTQALEEDPSFPEANTSLGAVYFRTGDIEKARAFMEKEITLHPNRITGLNNLTALLLETDSLARSQAVALSSRARQLRPYDRTAHLLRIRLESLSGASRDSLLTHVLESIAATDGDIYIITEGLTQLVRKGYFTEAETVGKTADSSEAPPVEMDDSAFDPAFENSPREWARQKGMAFYLLGYVYGITERFDEAVDFAERAVSLRPDMPEAWLNLANSYHAVGNALKADSILAEAESRFGQARLRSIRPNSR